MAKIGYARVSSTGQSLAVQLGKLNQVGCERIYKEKRSGRTANRLEFQSCMDYLREGDTLIVTRLDRLARSVNHLSELAKRFEKEQIDLLVIDQNIDTITIKEMIGNRHRKLRLRKKVKVIFILLNHEGLFTLTEPATSSSDK